MTIEHDKFWIVWRQNGSTPTYRHESKATAEMEAERLARCHPGEVFFVLKTISGFSTTVPPVERIKLKTPAEIPF